MQDRFKYKIYDKKHNKMISSDEPLRILFNYEREEISFLEDFWREIPFNECEILQCTGLKDKNGKLIFEGDLLKIEINKLDGESYNKHSFEEAFYGYVHWYSSSYEICLDLDNEKTKSFPLYFDKYEVIGNLYENPELLKEVQGE